MRGGIVTSAAHLSRMDEIQQTFRIKFNAYTTREARYDAARVGFSCDADLISVERGAFPGSFFATLDADAGFPSRVAIFVEKRRWMNLELVPEETSP